MKVQVIYINGPQEEIDDVRYVSICPKSDFKSEAVAIIYRFYCMPTKYIPIALVENISICEKR